MANKLLLERVQAIQSMLMAVHSAGASLSANSKGREREAFVHDFLANAMPPIYRFGTGDATDAAGNRSGQLDVVIEHPFAPNVPVGAAHPTRLYLAEAVAAVVEVKSDVATQWSEAQRTAAALSPLRRRFALSMSMGRDPSETLPLYVVGYKGWKNIETLKAKLTEAPGVRGILVIESGYYCAKGVEARGPSGLWAFISDLFAEIASLQSASAHPATYLLNEPMDGIKAKRPQTVMSLGSPLTPSSIGPRK